MAGEALFPEVLGYEDTVLPQLENALLAGHDVIFLGERGQAKTRIIRSLTGLLDEWMPIIAGSEINDDPYAPVSRYARRPRRRARRRHARSSWVHRDQRFGEKLATPDTSIADLIGEVDPIKVAEGRYLSDELTLHYGLVPRTNRGIFAINELPDLAERIQVGLLNVLEERDIQVRGYQIRLPLDVLLVASANPEDYTNRGRIDHPAEGPLRQRRSAPTTRSRSTTELAIMRQEARCAVGRRAVDVRCPTTSAEVDRDGQPPGPGQHPRQPAQRRERAPVGDEPRGGGGQRRCAGGCGRRARRRAARRRPRGDGRQLRRQDRDRVARRGPARARSSTTSCKGAVLTVFKDRVAPEQTRGDRRRVRGGRGRRHRRGRVVGASSPTSSRRCRRCARRSVALTGGDESPAAVAAAVAFVLEGLHLSKRLNKDTSGGRATYRAR